MSDAPLLREQIEYYRRRAPEYDDWFVAEHGFQVQVTLTPTLWIAVARRHRDGSHHGHSVAR